MPEMNFAQALNATLREEMQRDPAVVLLGEDVAVHGGVFTVSKGLLAEFGPEPGPRYAHFRSRVHWTRGGRRRDGHASHRRNHVYGLYARRRGLRDQPGSQDALYDRRASPGADGHSHTTGWRRGNGAQHSQSLDALFAHVPGLKVVMPSTPYDAKGLLKSAIRDNNPVMFIEHKLLYFMQGQVPDTEYTLPLGKADVKRAGSDVTVVGLSRSVLHALEAAEKLAAEGISVEVIDPRTVRPFDFETILNSVRKTHRVVLVHEAVQFGSVISEIAATIQEQAFDALDGPIQRVRRGQPTRIQACLLNRRNYPMPKQ